MLSCRLKNGHTHNTERPDGAIQTSQLFIMNFHSIKLRTYIHHHIENKMREFIIYLQINFIYIKKKDKQMIAVTTSITYWLATKTTLIHIQNVLAVMTYKSTFTPFIYENRTNRRLKLKEMSEISFNLSHVHRFTIWNDAKFHLRKTDRIIVN